ncbi:hypothetical protein HPP92_001385 [Vanilla planifolia]|uniref:Sec16 Sec23-binding domain-containing protein n=1 Tax=Vanilla planifolia TaxID=51239 RepID=A0A835RW59_VANPL|nr:hypothetical protein HPP92_001385 [Vanilla planifolia]
MFEEDGTARTKLLSHLGFRVPTEQFEVSPDELGKELTDTIGFDDNSRKGKLFEVDGAPFNMDNGDDFFNNLQSSDDTPLIEEKEPSDEKQSPRETETAPDDSDSSFDDAIQRALVVGDYKEAVHLCITAKRLADALVIAHVGGPSLWEGVRDKYLQNGISPYLKIVAAMVNNDLMALVNTRPLSSWKETLALLCTFAQKEEWTVLCDTLGSRLLTAGNTLAATLCYICAGNIDKIVEIWSYSLKGEQDGRSYVDLLQDLMEKTIMLALASGQKQLSASLSKLVENYAELLASQGLLSTAMEYLKLLGSEDSVNELAILRDRIALSMEERASKSLSFEESLPKHDPIYTTGGAAVGTVKGSVLDHQDNLQLQQQHNIPNPQYGDGYQRTLGTYGGYPQVPPLQTGQQYPTYTNPVQFQPTQTLIPSQVNVLPQKNIVQPTAPPQHVPGIFVPANPPVLKNADGYVQPPTLGNHLYQGVSNQNYQPGPSGPAPGIGAPQLRPFPGHRFPQPGTSPVGTGLMPVNRPTFGPNASLNPVQPSSPTQQAQQSVVAPPTPPPTVQTVDTSKVPADLQPVIGTLTRLYHETSEALGGQRAIPAKKREIEDNSRKIGALFVKLNSGDISPNASSKLRQLCQALDAGDFSAALHIQVLLTTSDWDECNFWLAALKRMIKTRQNVRI